MTYILVFQRSPWPMKQQTFLKPFIGFITSKVQNPILGVHVRNYLCMDNLLQPGSARAPRLPAKSKGEKADVQSFPPLTRGCGNPFNISPTYNS